MQRIIFCSYRLIYFKQSNIIPPLSHSDTI